MFVGNILGKTDAAAVGASSILVTYLIGLFTGILTGTEVVTAQYWGAGKQEKVILYMEDALFLGGVGGISLSGIGMALSQQALIRLTLSSLFVHQWIRGGCRGSFYSVF